MNATHPPATAGTDLIGPIVVLRASTQFGSLPKSLMASPPDVRKGSAFPWPQKSERLRLGIAGEGTQSFTQE